MAKATYSLSRFIGLMWVVVIYSLLYTPLLVFFLFSFNQAHFPAPWIGFTLEWYRMLMQDSAIWTAVLNSVWVAMTAVLLSSVMGMCFILYASVHGVAFKRYIAFFYTNLMVPEIVLAVGFVSICNALHIPLGFVTLVIIHTILGLGYVIPILYSRYEELDYRLMEAAQDLGATTMQSFWTVTFPLLWPAIMGAAVLVFLISFDDFVLAYFCAGTTFETLPLYILSMLRVGVSPIVNALSALLLIISSVLIVVYSYLKARDKIF